MIEFFLSERFKCILRQNVWVNILSLWYKSKLCSSEPWVKHRVTVIFRLACCFQHAVTVVWEPHTPHTVHDDWCISVGCTVMCYCLCFRGPVMEQEELWCKVLSAAVLGAAAEHWCAFYLLGPASFFICICMSCWKLIVKHVQPRCSLQRYSCYLSGSNSRQTQRFLFLYSVCCQQIVTHTKV